MAIEKMEMLNLVAPLEQLNPIVRAVIMLGNVHIVNASNEISESNFTIGVMERNIHKLTDMSAVRPYREDTNYKAIGKKINELMGYFNMDLLIKEKHLGNNYDFAQTIKEIDKIYYEVMPIHQEIERLEEVSADLEAFEGHIQYLKGLDIELEELSQLEFFNYKIGILSQENRLKIRKNYENISAIVLHVGSTPAKGEVYMIIFPKEFKLETDRILRSLNFQELNIPKEFSGKPSKIKEKLEAQKNEICARLETLYEQMATRKERYEDLVDRAYSRLQMEEEMIKIKNETACTNNFFYLAGWVPKSAKEDLVKRIEELSEQILIKFKKASEVHQHMIPPTKMKNSSLFKPFESLVRMYGTPSYDELDPTLLLTVTYLFLFGAMFGDVGQGLVLFLIGLFLRKKQELAEFAGIFVRLGISATIFGFLYGSLFGFEHILPALLIRPMDNIDQMLLGSVILGVILLIISFAVSMLNAWKQKDLKEGLFGRNGLAGIIFYIFLLVFIYNIATGQNILSNKLCYIMMVISMVLVVIREPLANTILGKRPLYEESASSYYMESGFEVFETILNMLSGTLSFIRVGAFALNHAGLFIAFHTMAEITGNLTGSILIYIIGNVIIIGLEGLIVFIQGLRLEYYEMFGKYYRGEGIPFQPIRLNFEKLNVLEKTEFLGKKEKNFLEREA